MLVSAQEFLAESDIIIDVRSPSEYALSHIPNALNLAVLNDVQRHRIGTLYKQNPFSAKMLGASLICENIARFLPQLESLQITPQKSSESTARVAVCAAFHCRAFYKILAFVHCV